MAATERGLDETKPIVVSGVKGLKSAAFRKKFRNMAAYGKWAETDDAGNYEVQYIEQDPSVVQESEETGRRDLAGDPIMPPNQHGVEDYCVYDERHTVKHTVRDLHGALKLMRTNGHPDWTVGSVYRSRVGKMWNYDYEPMSWSDHHGCFMLDEQATVHPARALVEELRLTEDTDYQKAKEFIKQQLKADRVELENNDGLQFYAHELGLPNEGLDFDWDGFQDGLRRLMGAKHVEVDNLGDGESVIVMVAMT